MSCENGKGMTEDVIKQQATCCGARNWRSIYLYPAIITYLASVSLVVAMTFVQDYGIAHIRQVLSVLILSSMYAVFLAGSKVIIRRHEAAKNKRLPKLVMVSWWFFLGVGAVYLTLGIVHGCIWLASRSGA